MKTLNDIDFKSKKALVRVDFNVPLNENFEVTDNTRIKAAKPTVIKILEDGGSCVLMSHLGRPKGIQDEFSLRHIVDEVEDVFGVEVGFVNNCIGPEAQKAVAALEPGQILILENLRFYEEEKKGDPDFAHELSLLGDVYVNDAFGTAHRAHASTATVAKFFPDNKCFGALMAKEIESIKRVMESGEKPITAILGGAKVSSKITIIENILDKVDHLIIGGGMTFTFIKAQGGQIGNSLVEEDKLELALEILKMVESKKVEMHLPIDAKIADAFNNDAKTTIAAIDEIPDGWMGLDIGPGTIEKFRAIITSSKTILWNGPLGVFEMPTFSEGTIAVGKAIAEATKAGSFSLVGGGDSVAAAKQFGLAQKMSYVSTGGGAMLESLEGKLLPGIAAIMD
ncbi:MAG: phosphoglycerate kinase [Flavobacteriaceae bacterium]|nr:phosphoglycerate kinase [Flavobacteriaceae bacterium]